RMASRILGMGDVLTLIEQAEQVVDQEKAMSSAERMASGELTLEDFLEQMMMIRKMGPPGNILKMLPGGSQMSQLAYMADETQLVGRQATTRGLTPADRNAPNRLNASRRKRIAAGSGVQVSEVNQLVERFFDAKTMLGRMAGQFGMPGGRSATKKQKNHRKGKGKKGRNKNRRSPQRMNRQGMPGMP